MGTALDNIYIIELNMASILYYGTIWKLRPNRLPKFLFFLPPKFLNVKPADNSIFIYPVSSCYTLCFSSGILLKKYI